MRAVGLAGQARSRSPDWMRAHLAPALQALAALGAPILHYKVCSTFDSSPQIGSIGCAIELALPLVAGRWSPMVIGAPRLGRHQAFGHLFAVAQGVGHRLDRHPTMSRHPVTPMHESDLALHLGAQTTLRRALIDFTQLKAGAGAARLAAICAAADAPALLAAMRAHPLGQDAAIIGEVIADPRCFVRARTPFGGERLVDWLNGEMLPRIC